MKSLLFISLLTILRLGIPTIFLLFIGEVIKNRYENIRSS
jgi:hypothetical protein